MVNTNKFKTKLDLDKIHNMKLDSDQQPTLHANSKDVQIATENNVVLNIKESYQDEVIYSF